MHSSCVPVMVRPIALSKTARPDYSGEFDCYRGGKGKRVIRPVDPEINGMAAIEPSAVRKSQLAGRYIADNFVHMSSY